jgi:hypothetical protein
MKKALLIGIIIVSTFASCDRLVNDPNDEYIFKTNDGLEYMYSDFELYDSSTHIFYFKTNQPEFKTEISSTFSLLANGEEIYKGVFRPSYSSSLPQGPYISSSPSFYPDYTFRIELITIDDQPQDSRNDPRLIAALEKHKLLHSGLSAEIKDIIINGFHLTFSFIITNKDNSELLILDPEKMGPKLFHYFTNAPVFYNITQKKVFSYNTDFQAPSPWNSWSKDWLSELKSGDSRQFTFDYTINSLLTPGDYKVSFEFPGLSHQITKDQLFQNNKRIWLGDISLTKELKIQ